MLIDDFGQSVIRFEELLQRISSSMTTGRVFEKLPPIELWERSETDVGSVESLTEQLKGFMLTLKPEKVQTIRERTEAFLQPLSDFREILHRGSEDPLADSRLALEELRKAVIEGSNFLDLAKEVRRRPSESISEVLKLKEVYDAKEYLSAIPVPEATYVRFEGLRKNIKRLELSISNLEQSLEKVRDDLDSVVEETMKFRHLSIEESEKKQTKPEVSPEEETGPEPSLVS